MWHILLRILTRYWRWFAGSAVIANHDLPDCLFQIMEGPRPPGEFISNGCSFSPDRLFGADLRPAGHFHDYGYGLAKSESERRRFDYMFYRNLRRCGASNWMARKYFYRVRAWGVLACPYNGNPSARPRGWQWLKLFFSRYIEW